MATLALTVLALPAADFKVTRAIAYKKPGGEKQLLDAYVPYGKKPLPTVLVVHGGAWTTGDKNQLRDYATSLAKRGYAAFAINYRLAPQHKHPAQIEDCRDAVRWLRTEGVKKYRVDASRIGAIGYSAGGHLVSMLAVTGLNKKDDPKGIGTRINVACAGGAPVEFRSFPGRANFLGFWLGGPRDEFPKVYNDASPMAHITKDDAPILFYHGGLDLLVNQTDVRNMSAALKKAGIDSVYHHIRGAEHLGAAMNQKALAAAYNFFDKHLKGKEQPVQVFILAGQSNMEGQGVVDMDHPKYYNGGNGILNRVMANSKNDARYKHLKDAKGDWTIRDDVFVRFRNKQGVMAGGLTIGFTGYGSDKSRHHIGPELQIGHQLGDATEAPVLLIKTAWGGKSLFKDFRPPSAGGKVGEYYTKMHAEVKEALDNIDREFPALAGRPFEIAGFIWFQGWNDMFNKDALEQYEDNLVHLIKDMRREYKKPKLSVVIGELGNGGPKAGKNMLSIRAAQKEAAQRKELGGHVKFVSTITFARPKEESPNGGHGHHWFGNAESYFLIGDALGKAMVELRK